MATAPYIDGTGTIRQRALSATSAGTTNNPDVAIFEINGSITASNPSVVATGGTVPADATLIGASDGTNLQALRATNATPMGTERGLIVRNIPEKPTITSVSGTIAISGDNTIVAAPGSGLSIYITHLVLQNESTTATTIILKGSSNLLRCLGQTQGSGLALTFPERREIKLATNTALILNLSGANSVGYSIGYYTGA
jgi:pectate lyase